MDQGLDYLQFLGLFTLIVKSGEKGTPVVDWVLSVDSPTRHEHSRCVLKPLSSTLGLRRFTSTGLFNWVRILTLGFSDIKFFVLLCLYFRYSSDGYLTSGRSLMGPLRFRVIPVRTGKTHN